jgi:cell division protein FtsB
MSWSGSESDEPGRPRPAGFRRSVRRPALTGRRVVIAAMAFFLVVLLESPTQTYLARRSAVAAAQRLREQLQVSLTELERDNTQWHDPAYIEREARSRLRFVRPGDTMYSVLGADGQGLSTSAPAATARVLGAHRPAWNAALWGSVTGADRSG